MPILRNAEKLQRLQQMARGRNGAPAAPKTKQQAIYLKRRGNDRKEPYIDYRALLAGQGLIMRYLAISYRPEPDESGLYVQGAWKQFRTLSEAQGWLSGRSKAGGRLYWGMATYDDLSQVIDAWIDPDTHHSVWLACRHYLGWRVAGL